MKDKKSGFDLTTILGDQSKPIAPAGLDIIMIPAGNICPNPENKIYDIGDVSILKADIAEKGLRSPLEVVSRGPVYMLIAGHRRLTACKQLLDEGDERFAYLPCIVVASQGADADLISLITSNATARELSDGEKLKQYAALDGALKRQKAAGHLDGRVRDEIVRITKNGSGTLGRYAAILNNCTPDVIKMVEDGQCSITRAYEASKLYKVMQKTYVKMGYARMPTCDNSYIRAAIQWIVNVGNKDFLSKLNYTLDRYSYHYDDDPNKYEITTTVIRVGNEDIRISSDNNKFIVEQLDCDDKDQVVANGYIYYSNADLYKAAKKAYCNNKEIIKKKTDKIKKEEDPEKKKKMIVNETVQKIMDNVDNWEVIAKVKPLDLIFRRFPMFDGGNITFEIDLKTEETDYKPGVYGRFKYGSVRAMRYNQNGERVPMYFRNGQICWEGLEIVRMALAKMVMENEL